MASRPSIIVSLALALGASSQSVNAAEGVATAAVIQKAALAPDTGERQAGFIHKLFRPEKPSGRIMILMHGSGGDESTLVSLASKIAPDATLIGIRGRVVQDGVKRWYKRVTATEFDQQDVRAEAAAFASFLSDLAVKQKLDLSAATFLGYSNGANLIAAMTQLYPDVVRKAVLLRAMQVLSETDSVDLSDSRFLTIAGEKDKLYFPFAPKLEAMLKGNGAKVDFRVIPSGHGIGDDDVRIVAEWLGSPAK